MTAKTKTQIERLRTLREWWTTSIKPEQVYPGLAKWGCGSQACLGGWLSVSGLFPEIPQRTLQGDPFAYSVGLYPDNFFGVSHLFYLRDHILLNKEPADLSDYDLVTWRIDQAIANPEQT